MGKLLKGNVRLVKGGTIFAGTYIGAMVFSWILASDTLLKLLVFLSTPGLWLAEVFVKYLRVDHGVQWMAAFPPDLSGTVQSPLGANAISIIVIGTLLNVVIYYGIGYILAKKLK